MTCRALILGSAFLRFLPLPPTWTVSGSGALQRLPVTLTFTFKAIGETLTGSTTAPDGTETVISDGKIEGNKLSFAGTIMFIGRPFLVTYTGVLAGKELRLTVDIGGQTVDFIVKKE